MTFAPQNPLFASKESGIKLLDRRSISTRSSVPWIRFAVSWRRPGISPWVGFGVGTSRSVRSKTRQFLQSFVHPGTSLASTSIASESENGLGYELVDAAIIIVPDQSRPVAPLRSTAPFDLSDLGNNIDLKERQSVNESASVRVTWKPGLPKPRGGFRSPHGSHVPAPELAMEAKCAPDFGNG
jgi:hypothetical protein